MQRTHGPRPQGPQLRGWLLLLAGVLALVLGAPAAVAEGDDRHPAAGADAEASWRSPDDLIVTVPAEVDEAGVQRVAARLADHGQVIDLDLADEAGNRLLGLRTLPAAPVTAGQLASDEGVAQVEHAPVHRLQQPGDQRPSTRVDLDDPRLDEQWGLVEHQIVDLWDRGALELDDPPTIAVLDTGVDATPSLPAERIRPGWDVIMNQPHEGDVALNPHGTPVAKVAAAGADDGYGAAGVCPSCEILPLIVIDDLSGLDDPRVTALDIAIGMDLAVANGAAVINLSLGSPVGDPFTEAASRDAVDAGVAVVAAAGNDGIAARNYPAGYDDVLAVGGLAPSGSAHPASNRGQWVGTATPFVHPVGAVGSAAGTSFSAPMVSGAVALGAGLDDAVDALDMVEGIVETGADHDAFAGTLRADDAFAAARGEQLDGDLVAVDDADGDVRFERLAGSDRFATAAEVAASEWSAGTDTAVVATARTFPDALVAGAALRGDGPVLLVEDGVPEVTADALNRLEVQEVLLAGGEAAVPATVEDALAEDRDVERLAGRDRAGTAAALALARFETSEEVVLADGWAQGDALEAAALAARRGVPALLIDRDGVPEDTRSALEDLEAGSVVLYGAFDEHVEDELADAFDVTLVDPEQPPSPADEVLLARSDDLADALAGTALAGAREAALVRVDRDGLSQRQHDHLASVRPSLLTVLGGDAAVPADVVEAAIDAAQADPPDPPDPES